MAKRKQKEFSDWYGNPIPNERGIGIAVSTPHLFFVGEIDSDGKKYIRAYTSGGVPGDRLPLEDCFCCIKNTKGKVVYDSRCDPPPGAKLLSNYIGYAREKQL